MRLQINGERLWARLMEMAAIGATASGGCNRQALTDLDIAGRDLLMRWARARTSRRASTPSHCSWRRAGAMKACRW